MSGGPRLYYLDDIPTPYRMDVHRRVAELWPGQYRLAFCAASEPGRDWSFDYDGLDIEILPGFQFRPRRQVNPISLKWNPSVRRSLTRFCPDAVAISGYFQPTSHMAAGWCRRHKVPYAIACETSLRSSSLHGFRAEAKRRLVKPMVQNMAFGLPVGREAAGFLENLGAHDVPMFYFPNTPNVTKIADKTTGVRTAGNGVMVRRRYGLGESERIVLFVGRMIEAKRPADLLNAFVKAGDQLRGCVLVMVGDGPLLPQLQQIGADHANIRFPGWISNPDDLFQLMAVASVMVLPSQHEPWGAVVNEAMAAGVPVIASDRVGAAAELIEHGRNGFIFEVGNVVQLAELLVSALSDPAALALAGRAAQKTALAHGHEFAARNLIAGALAAIGSDNMSPASTFAEGSTR